MECMSWFVPIVPGKLEAWKQFTAESNGPRREEHAASRKRVGITREVAALVQTPQGDFTSVFLEAEDIAKSFKMMLDSEDPYDIWFMERTADVHGMTREMLSGPLPSEVYFDYRAEGMEGETARRTQAGKTSADTD